MNRLLPPLLAVVLLALMCAITVWVPEAIAHTVATRVAGGCILLLGLFLSIAAKQQFKQANTNINTFEQPTTLVTTGLFRFSRNPMYLGLLLILLGAALLLNNVWALLGCIAFFFAAAFWYIPFEERAAQKSFGDAYRQYCESVRRWL